MNILKSIPRKAIAIIFIFSTVIVFGQKRKSLIGKKAPALTIEKFYNSEGATSNIDQLKGKVIVLDFWGSWCGPCIGSFSHMNELVKEFKNKPVQFITVGYEDSEKAKRILDKHNVMAWRAIDTDLSVFTDYIAWSIPLTTIIDKNGKVIGEMHPADLKKETIKLALDGKNIQDKKDVELPYFEPEGAKEHFLNAVKD